MKKGFFCFILILCVFSSSLSIFASENPFSYEPYAIIRPPYEYYNAVAPYLHTYSKGYSGPSFAVDFCCFNRLQTEYQIVRFVVSGINTTDISEVYFFTSSGEPRVGVSGASGSVYGYAVYYRFDINGLSYLNPTDDTYTFSSSSPSFTWSVPVSSDQTYDVYVQYYNKCDNITFGSRGSSILLHDNESVQYPFAGADYGARGFPYYFKLYSNVNVVDFPRSSSQNYYTPRVYFFSNDSDAYYTVGPNTTGDYAYPTFSYYSSSGSASYRGIYFYSREGNVVSGTLTDSPWSFTYAFYSQPSDIDLIYTCNRFRFSDGTITEPLNPNIDLDTSMSDEVLQDAENVGGFFDDTISDFNSFFDEMDTSSIVSSLTPFKALFTSVYSFFLSDTILPILIFLLVVWVLCKFAFGLKSKGKDKGGGDSS